MIFIYSTAANQEEADRLATLILDKKLAACVNSWPNRSQYLWEGKIETSEEITMIIKTTEAQFQKIEQLIQENHSYKVPCIVAVDIKRSNPSYKEWLMGIVE